MAILKWAILLVSIPAVFSASLFDSQNLKMSCQYAGWGDRRCLCDPGYLYENGKCYAKKMIGEKCSLKSDVCATEHSQCVMNIECMCSGGYRQEGMRCVRKELGSECYLNADCMLAIKHSRCYHGECACFDSYFPRDGQCYAEKSLGDTCITALSDVCTTANSACIGGQCLCVAGYHKDGQKCARNKLGSECKNLGDCMVIDHSTCYDGRCTCGQYYTPQGGQCVAGLNAPCKAIGECKADNSECKLLENRCNCKSDHVAIDGECTPKTTHNETCMYNAQCSASVPHTICKDAEPGKKRCECEDAYYFNGKECRPRKYAGEVCAAEGDCFAPDSHCVDKKCQCDLGYKQVGSQCVLRKPGDDCTDNKECIYANSKCKNEKCSCKDDYLVQEGQCVAGSGFNVTCQTSEECKTMNSECNQSERICKCKPNHIFIVENNQCMPKAKYNGKCDYDVQCSEALAHTTCKPGQAKDKRCACENDYYFDSKECRQNKIVGEVCEVGDCITPYSHCGDGRCKCNKGFSQVGEHCEFRLGLECEEDSDCGSDVFTCKNNKCANKE